MHIKYNGAGVPVPTCFDIHIFLTNLSIFFYRYVYFSVGTVILRFVYYFIVYWVLTDFLFLKTDKCGDIL